MAKFNAKQQKKPKFQNQKNRVASNIKKKAIKNKNVKNGDARLKIMSKNRKKFGDARDKLANLAKTKDARLTIVKKQNLKEGKLDVKTTKNGGITVTKLTSGKTVLTTKHKEVLAKKLGQNPNDMVVKVGKNLTKSVNPDGKISLSTKPKQSLLKSTKNKSTAKVVKKRPTAEVVRKPELKKVLTKTIKGKMSRQALLDEELLNTHVDPVVIRRTVQQEVNRRQRSRSRSPRRFHYDDPRSFAREDEILRQRFQDQHHEDLRRQLPVENGFVRVVVSNLNGSVSRDDLYELMGDIGRLERIKMLSEPGSAEVVFVHKEDADRAIEVYHNRQLDGKPMKCQLITAPRSSGAPLRLAPSSSSSRRYDSESERSGGLDVTSIHKALFSDRKTSGSTAVPFATSGATKSVAAPTKQQVTVTMGKGQNRGFPQRRRR